ncbi:MAG: universal stress protein [Calditrichaeota bacterium]|nr:universal stress protein [Calditrichota bacterium]
MLSVKRIVCPVDFSGCSLIALKAAIDFALVFKAELHVLHINVQPLQDENSLGFFVKDYTHALQVLSRKAEDQLHELEKTFPAGLDYVLEQLNGYTVATNIIDYVKSQRIDMVFIGRHGKTGFKEFFLGSVSDQLIKSVAVPVVSVRDKKIRSQSDTLFVPIDFSDFSKEAIALAKQLAKQFNYKISYCYVLDETVYPSRLDRLLNYSDQTKAHIKKELTDFVRDVKGPEVDEKFLVKSGRPNLEICKAAESEKAKLIIMAAHGLSGFEHFLIGSTTEKVLKRSKLPVLSFQTFKLK